MVIGQEYRGIKFVRLQDLPSELNRDIRNWLNDDTLIKIQTDAGLLNDCIQLKDFEYWYDHIYTPVDQISETGQTKVVKRRKIKLAFER
ncbi:MAG: hypothetical protein P8X57_02390 [Cyclobacteriaceae bacterium]